MITDIIDSTEAHQYPGHGGGRELAFPLALEAGGYARAFTG